MVLYHVPDPETAIAELARVLDAGGLLLASTGSDDDLERRLAWARLFDEEPQPESPPLSFSRENGRDLLLEHFRDVEQVDCDAALVFHTREQLVRYVRAPPTRTGDGRERPRADGAVPPSGKGDRLPGAHAQMNNAVPRRVVGNRCLIVAHATSV